MSDTTEGKRTPEVRQSYGAAASRYSQEQKLGARLIEILREWDKPDGVGTCETMEALMAAARTLGLLGDTASAVDGVGFYCQECGRKHRTAKAAERAMSVGCPKCGGCDTDLGKPKVRS